MKTDYLIGLYPYEAPTAQQPPTDLEQVAIDWLLDRDVKDLTNGHRQLRALIQSEESPEEMRAQLWSILPNLTIGIVAVDRSTVPEGSDELRTWIDQTLNGHYIDPNA